MTSVCDSTQRKLRYRPCIQKTDLQEKYQSWLKRPLQLRCLLQLTTSSNHYTHATTPTIETNYTYTTVKLDFLLKPILYHLLSVRKKSSKALYLPPPSCEGLPHQTCPPTVCSPRRPPRSSNVYGTFQRPRSHPEHQDLKKKMWMMLSILRCCF